MELIITNKARQKFTILYDECDHELISKYRWHIVNAARPYARTKLEKEGWYKQIMFHNLIFNNIEMEYMLDHINRNTLDNRRVNLRRVTRSQNSSNRTPHGRSKYLGVCLSTNRSKWQAAININKKFIALGRFINEEDAAKAYDAAAKIYHGEFANLNFPEFKIID